MGFPCSKKRLTLAALLLAGLLLCLFSPTARALRALPDWQEGCVLHDQAQDRRWCFYSGKLDEKQLKAGLKERLARYMLPDRFVHLHDMPHTANMKIDRQRLRQMMQKAETETETEA